MTSRLASCLRRPAFLYAAASLILCAVVLKPFYWPVGGGMDAAGHQIGRDFINTWAGPRLAFDGRIATLFDLEGYVAAISDLFGRPLPFHNWSYPPSILILFWPFAQLPYFWALAAWTLVFLGIYAAMGMRLTSPERRLPMLIVLACAPATLVNVVGGQNGFATAALFVGGVLALERRPILAGVLFGLLTVKPQLGLVLPLALIALGAWRTIAAASGTAALLVGVSVAAFGLEPWRQYLTETGAFQLSALKSFQGFFPYMMTSVLAGARTFGAPFAAAAVAQAAVSLPVLLAAAWAVTRTTDARRRALVLASAAPLVTPYAFNYDLTALTLLLSLRLVEDEGASGAGALALRVAWLVPVMLMPLNIVGIGAAPLAILAVFVVAVAEAARAPDRAAVVAGA